MITVNSSGAPLSAGFAEALQEPTVSFDMALFANGSQLDGIIKRASIELGAGMAADGMQTFAPCGIYTTQFEAQVFGLGSLSVGDEAEVRVGVLVGQSYEYVTVAHVTVTERSEWQGIATVKGKGRMGLMNAPHGLYEGDYSPASIASAIHAVTGVTVSLGAFQGSQNAHIETGGTCRDALASMCARLGGYACEIGGGVSVLPYASGATYPVPESYVTGAELGTAAYTVDGITVRSSSGSFEFGTGRVEVEDATATAATAAVTWGNLQGYSFMPGSLKVAIVDPRVTPADTVGYSYDAGGATVNRNVPARGISITFDGGYFGTYTASGLTVQSEDELVGGPLSARVASAYELAREADEIARATGQYFWHDTAGAHVSTEAFDPVGNQNTLWNTEGMLFRKETTNLLAIVTSNTGGNATGISIYDGQGNGSNNIVASFTNNGATVGASDKNSMSLGATSMVMYDNEGATTMEIAPSTASSTKALVNRFSEVKPARGSSVTLHLATVPDLSVRSLGCEWDVRVGTSRDQYSFSFTAFGTTMSFSHAHCIMAVTPNSDGTVTVENASTRNVALNISDFKFTYSGSGIAPYYRFGNGTSAITGAYGFSHGSDCYPQADNSMASGEGCVAQAPEQHVFGRCNAIDNTSALIIGNGTGSTTAERSNAMTVDWDGNETLAGGLTATGRITGAGITSTNEVMLRNTNLTDGTAVSGIVNGSSQVSFLDSAGAPIGRLLSQFEGSTQHLYQFVQRTVNGSTKRNGLALGLDASGNPTVYMNAQDAWLTALGFSPIYYRDGTGFSDVFTAASGFTVDTGTFRYSQRGKFATVLIAVKNTSALTAGTFYTIGTLASGRRPYTQAPLTDTALGTVALAGIVYGSGIVSVRPRGNVPANSSIVVGGTIILA